MPTLLVIGGSDAGISCALRARELEPAVEIQLVVADEYPNFSICGLPFYLSGEITDWRTLAHRTLEELQSTGVQFFLRHTTRKIDPQEKSVTVTNRENQTITLNYDRLVIGTGVVPVRPSTIEADFDPITTESKHWDHKKYYPNPQELTIRLTGDRKTDKLLGAQILGHWHSEISKRVDIFAVALYHGMTIEELNNLDLSYTPPLSSPWDPVQMSAQAWGRYSGSSFVRATKSL